MKTVPTLTTGYLTGTLEAIHPILSMRDSDGDYHIWAYRRCSHIPPCIHQALKYLPIL